MQEGLALTLISAIPGVLVALGILAVQHTVQKTLPFSLVVLGVVLVPIGKLHVLQDVSFPVQSGESLTITGPSRSGKTTLLPLLGALESPDSGEIWLDA